MFVLRILLSACFVRALILYIMSFDICHVSLTDVDLIAIVHASNYPRSISTIRFRHDGTIVLKLLIPCILWRMYPMYCTNQMCSNLMRISDRFRYKLSIFREHKTSGHAWSLSCRVYTQSYFVVPAYVAWSKYCVTRCLKSFRLSRIY